MSPEDTIHQNVSYAHQTICNESRSSCDAREGTVLCTKNKHFSKRSFPVNLKSFLQNTSMKKPLTYSSQKLKQIGEKNGLKFQNSKLSFQMLGSKNIFLEKTDRSKCSELPFSEPPHPIGCDSTGSLESGFCCRNGEGQKISQSPPNKCVAGAKHDHTYAKKMQSI